MPIARGELILASDVSDIAQLVADEAVARAAGDALIATEITNLLATVTTNDSPTLTGSVTLSPSSLVITNLPTSPVGLASGQVWLDKGQFAIAGAPGQVSIGALATLQGQHTLVALGGPLDVASLLIAAANQTLVGTTDIGVAPPAFGAVVVTETPDTFSSLGTVRVSGALAVAQTAETLVSLGRGTVGGALAITQAAQPLVAAGIVASVVVRFGTLVVTETLDALSGTAVAGPDVITPVTAPPVNLNVGQPFSGTLATWSVSNKSVTAANFLGIVYWQDGTSSGGSQLSTTGGNGAFTTTLVTPKAFNAAGTYQVYHELDEQPPAGTSAGAVVIPFNVGVGNDTITPTGVAINATINVPRSGTVATFTINNVSRTLAQLQATIDWGDGTGVVAGTITGGSGNFTVSGTHTYTTLGSKSVGVTLSEIAPLTATATAFSTATVSVAASDVITPTGISFNATANNAFSGTVATFTDTNTTITAASMSAQIDWADGTGLQAGTVTGGSGAFVVTGTHTYALASTYNLTVVLSGNGATGSASSTATVSNAVAPPPPGTLRATLTFPSGTGVNLQQAGTYVFDEVGTSNGSTPHTLGNYLDPAARFTMTNVRATRPDSLFNVDFRRIAGWACIVFQQGSYQQGSTNLLGYTCVISDNSGTLATINVPFHPAFARWRWQSNAWPLAIPTPATLFSQGLLPAYDVALINTITDPSDVPPNVAYTPMGLAGMRAHVPTTGDDWTIGLFMGTQVDHIANPTAQTLSNVLAGGEAAASYSMYFKDQTTNTMIDGIIQWPRATINPNQSGPPVIQNAFPWPNVGILVTGPPSTVISGGKAIDPTTGLQFDVNTTIGAGGTVTISTSPGIQASTLVPSLAVNPTLSPPIAGVTLQWAPVFAGSYFVPGSGNDMDSAHMGNYSYLPFLLTGDPYHLENLQCAAMFDSIEEGSGGAPYNGFILQVRAQAWTIRTLAEVTRMTPSNAPDWLIPKATWQYQLDGWRAAYAAKLIDPNPKLTVFQSPASGWNPDPNIVNGVREAPGWTYMDPWQDDYHIQALSWVSLLHANWQPVAGFFLQSAIARSDPAANSGWCVNHPTSYEVQIRDSTPEAIANGSDPGTACYSSWGAAWAVNAQYGSFNAGLGACPVAPADGYMSGNYPSVLYGALAIAVQAGFPSARGGRDRMRAAAVQFGGMQRRHAFSAV